MIVPYYAQVESIHRVEAVLFEPDGPLNDPSWATSGARSPGEYATWVGSLCGMACLKMILAFRTGKVVPTVTLAKKCMTYGGYKIESQSRNLKGLYYKPFTEFVSKEYGLEAAVCVDFPGEKIREAANAGAFFLASVHPSIRTPEIEPPAKGGHLVLVYRNENDPEKLMFNNPSGFTPEMQKGVEIDIDSFKRFYAGRGILVKE